MKTPKIQDSQDHITKAAVKGSSTSLVPPGSVLVVVRSGILKHTLPVAITEREVALNQDLKAITPTEDILPEYLALGLKAFERRILDECCKDGTTVQNIKMPSFLRFELPIAPLPEQRRIVARIEELFSRFDAGVAALRHAKAQLQRYRQSVLAAAVTGELTREWREQHPDIKPAEELMERILAQRREQWDGRGKYKEPDAPDTTGLPEVPTLWTWGSLPQLGELNRGKSKHRPRNAVFLYGGRYPFVQTGEIRHANGTITNYSQTYSEEGLKQSRIWPKGTLCITIAANIAESAILGLEACFPDSIVGFIPTGQELDVRYYEFFMQTAREDLERYAPATAQKNIGLRILSEVAVPVPPPPRRTTPNRRRSRSPHHRHRPPRSRTRPPDHSLQPPPPIDPCFGIFGETLKYKTTANLRTIDLEQIVDAQIGEVRTDSLDLIFVEIANMRKGNELVIQPEYQRLFRWSNEQRSRLIESILLELPIPQIFVIENSDGVFKLIDGLQRISSVLQFIESDTPELEPLQLDGCDLITALNHLKFEDLPLSLRLRVKRSTVRTIVIRRQSKSFLRYEMFKRLNTGGSLLSPQEIRNCSSRMLGDEGLSFYAFLQELADLPCFKDFNLIMTNDSSASFVSKVPPSLKLRRTRWNSPPAPSGLRRPGAHLLKKGGAVAVIPSSRSPGCCWPWPSVSGLFLGLWVA